MSKASNVGNSQTYGNDDQVRIVWLRGISIKHVLTHVQRTYADEDIKTADRYKEGKENSHLANDSKDERTIANKLAREEQVREQCDLKS